MVHQFGATWWGKAWIDALEKRSGLDPNRLPRGRTYARQDRVSRLELEAGKVTALVRGSRALPYKVTVGVRIFDDTTWDRLVAAIAAKAGHAAALLDGELDPGVVADARGVDVDVLPGPGDLHPRCSCPDWADPCKHSAAVCYLVADALDDDPFLLFALRGRTREALLTEVRAHRRSDTPAGLRSADSASAEGGALIDPGVLARKAWQDFADREAQPKQVEPHLPDAPGTPSEWPTDPPADAPFTAEGLRKLAADAARRAWAQLADGDGSGLTLSQSADLARRASLLIEAGEPVVELARRAGETPTALTNRAAVWRHAGEDGLESADDALWRPPEPVVEAGRRALEEAGVDPANIQTRSNKVTVGDVQLRVTADGRWWRYERRGRAWDLVEAPSDDPADLVGGTD